PATREHAALTLHDALPIAALQAEVDAGGPRRRHSKRADRLLPASPAKPFRGHERRRRERSAPTAAAQRAVAVDEPLRHDVERIADLSAKAAPREHGARRR